MSTEAELAAWLAGTPTGGPNGDGRYPLTAKDGTVHLELCPAASLLNPTVPPAPVEIFANAAEASAIAAAASAVAADASADASAEDADAAEAAKDAAVAAKGAAEAAAATATTKAGEASSSATAASGSASAASGSAATAGAAATTATTKAGDATTAATTARAVVRQTMPSTFENDGAFFFAGYAGNPTAISSLTGTGNFTLVTVAGIGKVVQYNSTASAQDVAQLGVMTVMPGRTYRLTTRFRVLSGTRTFSPYLIGLNELYAYTPYPGQTANLTATTEWQTHTLTLSGDVMLAAGVTYIRGMARFGAGASVGQVAEIRLEDVTESVAAAASAASALADKNTASTHATTATNAKTAAETARDVTLGYRNTASTHATTATTQAGIATTKAGEANASAIAAAASADEATTAVANGQSVLDELASANLGDLASKDVVDWETDVINAPVFNNPVGFVVDGGTPFTAPADYVIRMNFGGVT